ncbi:double zinc ribbon domain-containing protein [Variovorax sp. WDL1]|uniref:double zinc ribbon domain-containing protein n=1 Tax=Variovorax sp. WDL1 TaxID=207745 RepID=UPI003FCD213C
MLRNISSGDHDRRGHGSSHRSAEHHGGRDHGRFEESPAQSAGSCTACRAPLASGTRYCGQCCLAAAARACGGCSTPLPDGARFCASCGKSA